MSGDLEKTSKFLSYILRHQPEAIGLNLDAEGWAGIADLIAKAGARGTALDRALIDRVLETSDKKRFTISEDGLRIRAAQGHSSQQVRINHIERQPPEILYHGTATRFLDSIERQGLKPGSRHHVHLSSDRLTAVAVGQRYGRAAVLTVKTALMSQRGFKFYLADNGVWLTEAVPPEYLVFE